MAAIYVVLSPGGTVTWKTTEYTARTKLCNTFRDFGAGSEAYTKCPGCGRELPLVVFDLDHIRAKARYYHGYLGPDTSIVALDAVTLRPADVRVTVEGGVVRIESGSIYNAKVHLVQSDVIWENDLANLQFLCVSCNRSKGKQTWDEWGKSLAEAKPLAAALP